MKSLTLVRWLTLLTFGVFLLGPLPAARAQTPIPASKIQAVLDTMTPEERVGQLFLVTFRGTDTSAESQIRDLISNYHVGGVVLQAGNDNFIAEPDTVTGAHQLINALQGMEWEATVSSSLPEQNTYVPLFIGVSQEGDGAPNDQILNGLTALPNEMAIGATWNTELAQQVGAVLGSELSALGFNLFLGPSLDVVESPNPFPQIDLGTRVFGGDPFWVGEMGRAYIAGLHAGSNARMLVVAKHFPGRGSSDRIPEQEIATVRKSLEQLEQIELPPFVAVTNSTEPAGLVDGLLVSHIRYQGFQGNIRATTRPVSFDQVALPAIIALPEFATWRENGGLIVSDALGSQAVRDFYSQGGEKFSPRLVAQDAFLAGNDLLYLGNITSDTIDGDTYSTTIGILDFFAQVYQNDADFARRVDAAVTRILAQKFRMYDLFTTANVLTTASGLADVGSAQQVVFEVARNAATLIDPNAQDLSTVLPAPPNQGDRIVFLTDISSYKQCGGCLQYDAMAADALQKVVVSLYGPNGSDQIFASRMNSFPLTELELMLNGESTTDIESFLGSADWLVVSLTDVSDGQITLLRRFFSERPALLRNRNVILFAFTAPYYLDATDISKLTAYYALYSKQPAFVEVAARLLFQPQVPLLGDSPVSIPAMEYDLLTETSPDPAQVIPLAVDEGTSLTPTPTSAVTPAGEVTPTSEATPATLEPTPITLYHIGDTISVRAGPILDHNQHIVPDDTIARFTMSTREETGEIFKQVEAYTTAGIARASFIIDKPGKVQISVISETALDSTLLQFDFDPSNPGAVLTVVGPTPSATPTPALPTSTAIPTVNDLVTPEGHPRVGAWLLVLLAVFGGALLMFWAVSRIVSPRWGLRWALCSFAGGLASYNYLALGLPGAAEWIASGAGAGGVLLITFIGEVLGGLAAWVWMQFLSEPVSPAD
jgi:beta-N-acetylhexosaminidase